MCLQIFASSTICLPERICLRNFTQSSGVEIFVVDDFINIFKIAMEPARNIPANVAVAAEANNAV